MASDDDFIYDAINVFKYSKTGKGAASISGHPSYVNRYKILATKVLNRLWNLRKKNEIGFHNFPTGPNGGITWGDALADRRGHDIRINTSAKNMAGLPVASSIMVHEAAHIEYGRPRVEEEIVCRIMEALFYKDLLQGITIRSKQTGSNITVKMPANSPLGQLKNNYEHFVNKTMVDHVVSMKTYRKYLAAQWVETSIGWWGGLPKRWPETKGHYVYALSLAGFSANTGLILDILESIKQKSHWEKMAKAAAGSSDKRLRIRQALGYAIHDPKKSNRIAKIQRLWASASTPSFLP